MIRSLVFAAVAGLLIAGPAAAQAPHATDAVTLDGVLHPDSDDTLAFTPDGNTVLFDRSEGPRKTVMVSTRVHGKWTPPRAAPFSGRWFDQDPVISPDGRYLLFNSDRPVTPGGKPLTQAYFKGGPGQWSNIRRVDRQGAGWGPPSAGPGHQQRRVHRFRQHRGRWHALFHALGHGGEGHAGLALGASRRDLPRSQIRHPGRPGDLDPRPCGRPGPVVHRLRLRQGRRRPGRLSIAFRQGAGWGPPIDLGDAANADKPWGAHIAPDGHTAYVTGDGGIRRQPLDFWLDSRRSPRPAPRRSP